MAGLQLADAAPEGVLVVIQKSLIQVGGDHLFVQAPQRHQRDKLFDLARKIEARSRGKQVQGLDRKTVAAQDDRTANGVEDSEGPHAVKPVEARFAVFMVELEENLGIGVS